MTISLPEAVDLEERKDGAIIRLGYRLTEKREKDVVHAFYGFAIHEDGHVQMAVYFDDQTNLELARGLTGKGDIHLIPLL